MEGCSGLVKGQMINTASGEIDSGTHPNMQMPLIKQMTELKTVDRCK